MDTVVLTRYGSTPMGTFGQIVVNGFKTYTVERPWMDNKRCISCIPGNRTYQMSLGTYNRGGYPAWELLDVPDRDYIKIHRANHSDQLKGCIALGLRLGYVEGRWAVTSSHSAYTGFMAAMGNVTQAQIIITKGSA